VAKQLWRSEWRRGRIKLLINMLDEQIAKVFEARARARAKGDYDCAEECMQSALRLLEQRDALQRELRQKGA